MNGTLRELASPFASTRLVVDIAVAVA